MLTNTFSMAGHPVHVAIHSRITQCQLNLVFSCSSPLATSLPLSFLEWGWMKHCKIHISLCSTKRGNPQWQPFPRLELFLMGLFDQELHEVFLPGLGVKAGGGRTWARMFSFDKLFGAK